MQKNSGSLFRTLTRSDGATGVAIVLGVLLLELFTGLVSGLENRFYDRASVMTGREPSDQVVVLAIDDQSISNIGRWPWPRDVHAKVIERLSEGKAKTIAQTTLFFEPEVDRGLPHLLNIQALLGQPNPDDPVAVKLNSLVAGAISDLDTDAALASSIRRSHQVILPMVFELGEPLGRPDQPLPGYVLKNAVPIQGDARFLTGTKAILPLGALGDAAAAVGHLNQAPDTSDGTLRADPLLIEHDGVWVPSLALQAAAHTLNLPSGELVAAGGGAFRMGGVTIPLDDIGRVYPQFYRDRDGRPPFVVDSFFDVYSGKIPPSKYAGKVVIIGATATGIGDRFVTPISTVTPPALAMAHTTASLLSGHFFKVPQWGGLASLSAVALVMVLVSVVLPRLTGGWAAVITAGALGTLLITEWSMLVTTHVWVPLVLPAAALALGYLGLTTKRFLFAEASKLKSDEESAETNRMMGLAHQGQGQLDMAFDRFRRVPLSDALMDNLANLALDFERKRQFNKAQAVYEHMAGYNANFKDLQSKLRRVKNLSETVLLGGGGGHKGGTMLLDSDHIEKPMLGRYQVEKELGKGAMGIVYLGRDPKISRVVAIKTLALAQEFEGDELEDARQRFFREAETAGRLQHQNIVTIFDAGEDQDLAYIAMEFLKGRDLVAHAQSGHLLPTSKVLDIVIQVAMALHYAHGLNVVHRDIKPANIMYDLESDTVKVTDFGIARVTDASKTKTGMVLGTPSFMSPEQIAGKKVDGRSDLYSLGVTAYQLLTGVLPFRAESMAELMYKIANETPPDIRLVNPKISEQLASVIARALAKSVDMRYSTGLEMAEDLKRCVDSVWDESTVSGSAAEQSEVAPSWNEPTVRFATTVVMAEPSNGTENGHRAHPEGESASRNRS